MIIRRFIWKTGLTIAALAITALVLEGYARLTDPGALSERWKNNLHLLEDLPERDTFLRDRAIAEKHPRMQYRDYYLAENRPLASKHINFKGAYGTARPCPDSAENPERIIWFFGGSTMEQVITAPDDRTIANHTIRRLNDEGTKAAGLNFGTRSFQSSLELIKLQDLLRRAPESEHPDVVVFYDGYNEFLFSLSPGPGRVPYQFTAPIKLLVERKHAHLLRYTLAELLGNHSVFCKRFISPSLKPEDPRMQKPRTKPGRKQVAHAVDVYETNLRMAKATCKAFGIKPLFVLQPLITSKQGLSEYETEALSQLAPPKQKFIRHCYTLAKERLSDFDGFADFSGVLDNNGKTDFYDLGHTGPYTGKEIGEAMARRIMAIP